MKRFAQNALRLLLAGLVLFATLAMARAVLQLFTGSGLARDAVPALLGFLGIVGVFCLGFRFHVLYVFGHELTHWLAAKAFRRRTSSFRVGLKGGSVRVERPNLFIVLCPYFVPLFSLVWIGLFGICLAIMGTVPDWLEFGFEIGLGATYGFHVVLTVWALGAGQSDMHVFGRALSMAVVLFGNTLILFLATMVASRQWSAGMAMFGGNVRDQWLGVAHGAAATLRVVQRLFGGVRGDRIDPADWVATFPTTL